MCIEERESGEIHKTGAVDSLYRRLFEDFQSTNQMPRAIPGRCCNAMTSRKTVLRLIITIQ